MNAQTTFHPAAIILYFFVLGLAAMTLTNPLYLGLLFLIVGLGLISNGAQQRWRHYLYFGLMTAITVVIVNLFIAQHGQTVLFKSSSLPLIGRFMITKESLYYAFAMSLKLLLILSIFCFYETMMNPDRAFSFFSRLAPKSALLVMLTSLMFPQMKRNLENVRTVMASRGAFFDNKNLAAKIISYYPLLKILLLSSLEGSWETAEALEARAFGATRRTNYTTEPWRLRDTVLVVSSIFALTAISGCFIQQKGFLTFYPVLGKIFEASDFYFLLWLGGSFGSLLVFALITKKWKPLS